MHHLASPAGKSGSDETRLALPALDRNLTAHAEPGEGWQPRHYILGERLRSGSAEAAAALARPGRYQQVADNLQVKEVKIADDERFIVCFNPEGAQRDAALRAVMVDKLTELIAGTDTSANASGPSWSGRSR